MDWTNIFLWLAVIASGFGAGRWIWDSAEILACEPHVHEHGPEPVAQNRLASKNGRSFTILGSITVLVVLALIIRQGPATWILGIAIGTWLVALGAIAFSDVLSRSMMDYHMILVGVAGLLITMAKFGTNWLDGALALLTHVLAGLVLGLLLWGLGRLVSWRMHQDALGIGDPMLVAAMSLALGGLATVASILLAAILGIVGHTLWHQRKGEHHIPFGLYLSMAGSLMVLAGLIWGPQSIWLPSLWPAD